MAFPALHRRSRMLGGTVIALALLVAACADDVNDPTPVPLPLEITFDLGSPEPPWVTGFADHPVHKEQDWKLAAYHRNLPPPLDTDQRALYFTGHNHSDDLMMYLYRHLDGLVAGVTYDVDFEVELATNAGEGCAGAGGSPGDSQWLKVGATNFEPGLYVHDEHYRLTADLGHQMEDGAHGIVVETIGVPTPCVGGDFLLKQLRTTTERPSVTTMVSGNAWLIIAVDSGYEGLMEVYFTRAKVTLTPRE